MSEAQAQMQFIPINELEYGKTRYIRRNVVKELEERIQTDGYNPARPLRVIPENGHYIVADGNHRLRALRGDFSEGKPNRGIPCVVEPDGDLYEIAGKSNRDEETYAPEDLFDHLYKIDDLREEDHTQEEIAEELSKGGDEWSRSKVSNYAVLLNNVATDILEAARAHQIGRVADDATSVANFSEKWFRVSGIYDLDEYHQEWFMDWFANEQNCDPGKQKVKRKVKELAAIQEQMEVLGEELNEGVDDKKRVELEDAINLGEHTKGSLRDAIEAANKNAQDQAYFGADSVEKLQAFEDNKIACVVTDPPWGVDHTTHRPNELPSFDGDLSGTMKLWAEVCNELQRVCKANAHIYVFFPSRHYTEVRDVLEEFFEVDPVPLQWIKNNHKPTRDTDGFKKKYVYQYESAFFCRMPNGESRELNKDVSPNVLHHDVPKGDDRWHSTQKPISLFEELLTNSTGAGETIMDPFAGSGSALLAAKRSGRHYIGIEKDDSYESRFKKELRKIEDGGDGDE